LNFLRISGDVRKSAAFPQLDLPEERLLDLLATYWSSGKKITVLKAMQMSSDASSTTVHRRLKTLRLKGMLELDLDEDDNRVKYIMPTQLALDYLSQLGQSILEAAATR
jgi:DNA-binding MarR family transcriptional regulator